MIAIKDIEILEVPENVVIVRNYDPPYAYSPTGEIPAPEKFEVTEEMIRGRRFRNSHGVDVCIGMSEKVQLALGLPFEAYDNLNTALMDSQKRRLDFIDKVHQASLWTRIKYVFTSRI